MTERSRVKMTNRHSTRCASKIRISMARNKTEFGRVWNFDVCDLWKSQFEPFRWAISHVRQKWNVSKCGCRGIILIFFFADAEYDGEPLTINYGAFRGENLWEINPSRCKSAWLICAVDAQTAHIHSRQIQHLWYRYTSLFKLSNIKTVEI